MDKKIFSDLHNEEFLKSQEHKFSIVKTEIDRLRSSLKEKKNEVKNLESKLEEVKQQTYQSGLNDGYQKAVEDIKEQMEHENNLKMQDLSNNVSKILNGVVNAKKSVILSAERELLELIFLVSEKIVNREIKKDDTVIIDVIKNILPHIDSYENIKIIANPNDLDVLRNNTKLWEPITLLKDDIIFEEKEKISRGGLIIHTKSGIVDARVEVELEHLKTKFLELWVASGDSEQQNK